MVLGHIMTAMPAVNAIPAVVRAAGIVTYPDFGCPCRAAGSAPTRGATRPAPPRPCPASRAAAPCRRTDRCRLGCGGTRRDEAQRRVAARGEVHDGPAAQPGRREGATDVVEQVALLVLGERQDLLDRPGLALLDALQHDLVVLGAVVRDPDQRLARLGVRRDAVERVVRSRDVDDLVAAVVGHVVTDRGRSHEEVVRRDEPAAPLRAADRPRPPARFSSAMIVTSAPISSGATLRRRRVRIEALVALADRHGQPHVGDRVAERGDVIRLGRRSSAAVLVVLPLASSSSPPHRRRGPGPQRPQRRSLATSSSSARFLPWCPPSPLLQPSVLSGGLVPLAQSDVRMAVSTSRWESTSFGLPTPTLRFRDPFCPSGPVRPASRELAPSRSLACQPER